MRKTAIALALALAAFAPLRADEDDISLTRNYDDEPALLEITPAERARAKRDLKRVEKRTKKYGIRLNREKMEKLKGERLFKVLAEYDRFTSIIEELPENFVKACGIGSVWFSDEIVDASGQHAGGFASGEGINLSMGADAGTIYHEMFHKFERCISAAERHDWEETNPEEFIYEGAAWDTFAGNDDASKKAIARRQKRQAAGKEKSARELRDEARSKKDAKRIAANQSDATVQAAFINSYAQTTPAEDRAEVFRAMICEGPGFLERARRSEHMRRKMEFMIRLTGTDKYLGKDFWTWRVEPERLGGANADPYGSIDDADWRRITAEEAGFDARRLDAIPRLIAKRKMGTTGLVVIVKGRLLYSWGDVSTPSDISSCWISLLSILYGKYCQSGRIDLDATLDSLGFDDEGGLLPREKKIRLRDLLSSRSGCFHPAADAPQSGAGKTRGSVMPDSDFFYNNWDFNAAAAAFAQLTRLDVVSAIDKDLAAALHFQDWRKAGQVRTGDTLVSRHLGYSISLSARDMARVGELMLRKGVWKGMRIVGKEWVETSTRAVSKFPSGGGFGYLWWVENESLDPKTWKGAFSARGLYGQRITVIPALDMVVAHKSAGGKSRPTRSEDYRLLVKLIVSAKTDSSRQ